MTVTEIAHEFYDPGIDSFELVSINGAPSFIEVFADNCNLVLLKKDIIAMAKALSVTAKDLEDSNARG